MAKVQLDLITGSGGKGDHWHIDGIPNRLWDEFREKAKDVMPEKGDSAWSSILCEAMASVCDGDSHTFIMTDIPIEARQNFDAACEHAECRSDEVIGHIWKAAQDKTVHIIRFSGVDEDVPPHALTIIGLPDSAWQAWANIASQYDQSAETLVGALFQAAANGGLKMDKTDGPA